MGRTPKLGDPRSRGIGAAEPGRDHWTHCQTALLAGGGIRGGQVYGSSDKIGAYPADHPVGPEHIVHTIYHAMGIHHLEAIDNQNRPYNLLSVYESYFGTIPYSNSLMGRPSPWIMEIGRPDGWTYCKSCSTPST